MGYVRQAPPSCLGLGESPKGDRRGLSFADARRKRSMVGATEDVRRNRPAEGHGSRQPQPRHGTTAAKLCSGVMTSSPASKRI